MANPLNFAVLDRFSIIFVLIFIFAIVYATLEFVKVFGEGKKNIHAMIAFAITIVAILTPDLVKMIRIMLPWVSLMIVFFFFLFAIPMFMGLKRDDVLTVMGGQKKIGAVSWVMGALIFLIVYSLGSIYGENLLVQGENGTTAINNISNEDNQFFGNVFTTVFNPKIIGVFMLMIISVISIAYLTRT